MKSRSEREDTYFDAFFNTVPPFLDPLSSAVHITP